MANTAFNPTGLIGVTKVIFLTSGTTYTPSIGVRALLVECVGGGGGGGGATAATSQCSVGSGGGGGGYAAKYVTGTIKSSYTYAIGAGGTAGAAANGTGGGGGTTSFDSPAICSVSGGGAGQGGTSGTTMAWTGNTPGGGTVVTGDFNVLGNRGQRGFRISGADGMAGGGAMAGGGFGSDMFGRTASVNGPGAGSGGNIYGGGADGALSTSATGFAGGVGGQGCIRITEYF